MSYCVHCGVELAPSEPVCPLCQTPVRDPHQPFDSAAPKPFPARLDLFTPQDNRWFVAAIVTLVLFLPAAICLACDIAYTSGAGWSMLVTGAMGMLWVFILPPLFIRKHRILFGGILDTAALLGYLWLVEHFIAPGLWFQQLAVPIVLLVDVLFVADYILLTRAIRGYFRQVAAALITTPVLLIGLEIFLDHFLTGRVHLVWSWIVAIPCVVLALLLLVLDRRQRFKQEMRKRLHL